jgi:hypothetical protein
MEQAVDALFASFAAEPVIWIAGLCLVVWGACILAGLDRGGSE